MSIRSTSIRFNLDKPPDREAWENLQGMDKRKYKSYSNVVALAVNEFFERRRKLKTDPYLETREREEQFVQQIGNPYLFKADGLVIQATYLPHVCRRLSDALPGLLIP